MVDRRCPRGTIATLARDKGHVKDIQGMMRHSRLATTTEVYMQSLEDGVRSTVNSIHDELSGTGTGGRKATTKHSMSVRGRQEVAGKAADNATKLLQRPIFAKPVRGVILEFATKMRQSRGTEVSKLLRCLVDLVGIEPTTSSMPLGLTLVSY